MTKKRLPAGLMCSCGTKAMYSSGLCLRCYTVEWRKSPSGRAWLKNYHDERTKSRRRLVYSKYGGKCSCCGESEEYFLTIDHINNDGSKNRDIHGSGERLYSFIIKNNFPKDIFQLLCMNCNLAKHRCGGVCPHRFKAE